MRQPSASIEKKPPNERTSRMVGKISSRLIFLIIKWFNSSEQKTIWFLVLFNQIPPQFLFD